MSTKTNHLLLFENKDVKKVISRLEFKVNEKRKIKKKLALSILNSLETKRLKIKKQILVAHTFISLKEIDSKINSIKFKSIKINSIKLKMIKLFRMIEVVIIKFYDHANEINVKLNFIATSALFVLNVNCIVNFKNIVLQKYRRLCEKLQRSSSHYFEVRAQNSRQRRIY